MEPLGNQHGSSWTHLGAILSCLGSHEPTKTLPEQLLEETLAEDHAWGAARGGYWAMLPHLRGHLGTISETRLLPNGPGGIVWRSRLFRHVPPLTKVASKRPQGLQRLHSKASWPAEGLVAASLVWPHKAAREAPRRKLGPPTLMAHRAAKEVSRKKLSLIS